MIHPAVQIALDAVAQALELVRLDFPELPPRQQDMIARSRCIEEITLANMALDRASHIPPLRPPGGATAAMPGRRG